MDLSVLNEVTYGMYVVSAKEGDRLNGCIINTCMQITSENPIFAISLNKQNLTYEMIKHTGRFALSILSEEVPGSVVAGFGYFSGREKEKFQNVSYQMVDDLPILNQHICGGLIFDVLSVQEMETHAVVFGRLKETVQGEKLEPMSYAFYHRVLKGKAPKTAPTYRAPEAEKPKQERYVCDICGYVYEGDITKEPDDFVCPMCGVSKEHFIKQ